MRVGWQELAPALDRFYDLAEGALAERQRLDGDGFAALDEFVGPMLHASATIRSEADAALSGATGEDHERVCELLLASAPLDVVLACDLAVLEPIADLERTAEPGLRDVFDGWARARRERDAEAPSPR